MYIEPSTRNLGILFKKFNKKQLGRIELKRLDKRKNGFWKKGVYSRKSSITARYLKKKLSKINTNKYENIVPKRVNTMKKYWELLLKKVFDKKAYVVAKSYYKFIKNKRYFYKKLIPSLKFLWKPGYNS
jgi:hypothetical protein